MKRGDLPGDLGSLIPEGGKGVLIGKRCGHAALDKRGADSLLVAFAP